MNVPRSVSWIVHFLSIVVQAFCVDHRSKSIYCVVNHSKVYEDENGCKTSCDTTSDCSNHDIHCPRSTSCKECTINCKHSKYCQNTRIFGNECDSITIINSNKRIPISNMTINTNHSSLLTLNTNGLIDSTIIRTKTKTETPKENVKSSFNSSFNLNQHKQKEEKEARTRIECNSNGENTFLNNMFVLSNGLKFLCDDFSALTFSSNLIYLSNKQELIEFLKSMILLNNSLIFDNNEFDFVNNYEFSKQFKMVCLLVFVSCLLFLDWSSMADKAVCCFDFCLCLVPCASQSWTKAVMMET